MVSSRAVVANICFIFVCVFGVDISFKGGGCKLGANVGEGDKKAPLFPCSIGMGGHICTFIAIVYRMTLTAFIISSLTWNSGSIL